LDLGAVTEAEAPLSKVMVPLPKIAAMEPTNASSDKSVARIAAHVDRLVGHYGWNELQACLAQVPNSRLNRVFEVADIRLI
jgi:hypothetical protein